MRTLLDFAILLIVLTFVHFYVVSLCACMYVCGVCIMWDVVSFRDLTFRRGDVVRLCKQIDENWYLGEIGGQQGYFPATYVEVCFM